MTDSSKEGSDQRTIESFPLHLADDLPLVTKYCVDYYRFGDINTANSLKKCMEQQLSKLLKPGRKVNVKVKEELVPAVIERFVFISASSKASEATSYQYIKIYVVCPSVRHGRSPEVARPRTKTCS